MATIFMQFFSFLFYTFFICFPTFFFAFSYFAATSAQAFEELEELLARHNICIAVKEKLVKDSGVADEIAYDSIVQKLLTKPRARGKLYCITSTKNKEKQNYYLPSCQVSYMSYLKCMIKWCLLIV